VEVGEIQPSHLISGVPPPHHIGRIRPIQPGISIGHFANSSAGTLGCIVWDERNQKEVLLSNHHVLTAILNSKTQNDAILQPGPLDKGVHPSDHIADLDRFCTISQNATNKVDAAVAAPIGGIHPSFALVGLQQLSPTGICGAYRGQPLRKVGRTTGYSTGHVMFTFSIDRPMNYFGIPNVEFEGIITTAMIDSGDSGSVALDLNSNEATVFFMELERTVKDQLSALLAA
jgi:hypothetical protein